MKTRLVPSVLLVVLLGAVASLPRLVLAQDTAPPKALADVLKPCVDRQDVAGVVALVADKDRFLSLDSVGYADIALQRIMGPDALFWIASQSKPITAVALMMLVDAGKVNLDDPVEKYLPEFKAVKIGPNKEQPEARTPAHPITVRQLLCHISGLPFQSEAERPTLDRLTLRAGSESYAKTPLLAEPGTHFQYSNAGINTAGRIIEVVSGMSYEEFLQKRLLDPLGMKDTTFWPSEEQIRRLAKSYKHTKTGLQETEISQLHYPLSDRKRQPMPAGGLFSTAHDVGRFCQMMLNGGTFQGQRLLSEGAVKEMTRRQTPKEVKQNWGLGWALTDNGYGHGGAHATNMSIDTQRGLITVFLVQQAGGGPAGRCQDEFRKAAEERFRK